MAVNHGGNTVTTLRTGKVLVAGDYSSTVSELFDPVSGTWSNTNGQMAVARTWHTATLLWSPACDNATAPPYCGKVLVAGGQVNSQATATAELYDPRTDAWEKTGSLIVARGNSGRGHTATLLADGRVLVAGGPAVGGAMTGIVGGVSSRTTEIYDPVAGTWSAGPLMAHERTEHTATLLGDGRVMVAGGRDLALNSIASAEILDPKDVSPAWKPAAAMTSPRQDHMAARLPDGSVLVAGGRTGAVIAGTSLASAEVYDREKDTWTPTGSMAQVRFNDASPVAVVLPGGRVLVAAGMLESGYGSVTSELYDPTTRRWSPAGASRGAVASLMDQQPCGSNCGRVLATGGSYGKEVEIYDPATPVPRPTITSLAHIGVNSCGDATLNSSLAQADMGNKIVINGTGFEPGGTEVRFGDTLALSYVIPDSGTQIEATIPPHAPGVVDITITTPGGVSPLSPADQYTYRAPAGRWKATGSPIFARYGATATPLRNGKVLVAGGLLAGNVATPTTELYDPVSAKWSVTAPMGQARTHHTATLLPNGEVLIAGGRTAFSRYGTPGGFTPMVSLATAELYNPLTGTWRPAGTMLTPRSDHTATLLAQAAGGARVLVAGGRQDVGLDFPETHQAIASAEVFDPQTNVWVPTGALATARYAHTASLLGDGKTVVVIGGATTVPDTSTRRVVFVDVPAPRVRDSAISSLEIYEPAAPDPQHPVFAGGWKSGPEALAVRLDHTANTLGDGRIAIVGGRLGTVANATNAADLFSLPVAVPGEPWATTSRMAVDRLGHTATSLPGGRLLVAGGVPFKTIGPAAVSAAEIYDQAAGTWELAGCMGEKRVNQTASLLWSDNPADCGVNCGRVLVAGGTDLVPDEVDSSAATPFGKSSAELYTPAPVVSGVSPGFGPVGGGTRVTVSGFGLTNNATAVSFGGTQIPVCPAVPAGPCFTVESYTKLTVVSPPFGGGTNPVDVTVTTDGGDSAVTPAARFAYGDRPVTDLAAAVVDGGPGPPLVDLSWSAPDDGTGVAPATAYVVKQSTAPITAENFDQAPSLCAATAGVCSAFTPPPSAVGQALGLSVSDLAPATTYYYALRPLDHDGGPGPLSNVASVTTAGSAIAGVVGDLAAVATSAGSVTLGFTAPPAYGDAPPPAADYVIKQSSAPITAESFDAATSLCDGRCHFAPTAVGDHLALVVDQLAGGTTYYYAMEALNPTTGAPGAISNVASATTPGCAPARSPGAGQVFYPGGYSLLGLPEGTVVPSDSPLYGWFDQGVGGAYSRRAPTEAVSGGRGYWAFFSCPRLVEISGAGTSALSAPQRAYHASMIGNPSATTAVKVSGYDFGALWDPTANAGTGGYKMSGYRQAATLPVGQALWTFSYSDTTVAIAP